MRGGWLPLALIALALGLSLAFVSRRTALLAVAAMAATAVMVFVVGPARRFEEIVFAGLWITTIATALSTHWPRGVPRGVTVAMGANAGAWAGAAAALAANAPDLALSLPLALVALPGAWLATQGGGIALKVVASWVAAVAVLALMLALTPTPGYVQDHMG